MVQKMIISMKKLPLFLTIVLQLLVPMVNGLGVNWGTQASQTLHPKIIVQMLKDNKINKIKLFDSDPWTVNFFAGTGIEVMLGIPNNQLVSLADSYGKAKDWVKKNLTRHLNDGGVQIKYVAVGNEPFLQSYNGSYEKTVFPALKNIQKAITEAGFTDRIKASIPQNADVYSSGTAGPSAGNFRSDIRDLMVQIVRFLQDNNAPFLVNIYPFISLYENPDFPVDYAFFDGDSKPVRDGGISYTNMVDANMDTLVSSLRKSGASRMKIIISEIGWPTDGTIAANVTMSNKFYDGLLKKMSTKKGTPLYPGDIDYYLFSLVDENLKSAAPGPFERHWGIFRYDGQPKFPMDFSGHSGHGKVAMPVAAKNVTYMDIKWCVYNPDLQNLQNVPGNMDYACMNSDCTSLNNDGSCSGLDQVGKLSYAFNMYFQMSGQDVQACDFGGVATTVTKNASTARCLFPIAIENSEGWKKRLFGETYFFVGFIVFMLFSN